MMLCIFSPKNPVTILIMASLLIFGFILGNQQENIFKVTPIAEEGYKNVDKYQSDTVWEENSKNEDENQQESFWDVNNRMKAEEKYSGHPGKRKGESKRLPGAIIIGAKKCGTGALSRMLNMHPDVHGKRREGHFFDHDHEGKDDTYPLGLEWYREIMPFSEPHQLIYEKTPRYFVDPVVPERIHAMNSSIKLILIVRDPVDRIVSDWAHTVRREKYLLKQKWVGKQGFVKEVLTQNGTLDEKSNIVIPSLYAVHMAQWLKYFKRDQILILNGNTLIKRPLHIMKQVEKFLNLNPWFNIKRFYFDEKKGFYCMRKAGEEHCLAKDKGRKHPKLNLRLLSFLRHKMVRHNERFYNMVGINFKWPKS